MSDLKENKKEVKLPENPIIDFSFEKTLKTFLKDIRKQGIIEEVKRRQRYEKPSETLRRYKREIERKYKMKRKWKSK